MALRTSWKGFLRLSLVSVPVKAYTARASGSDVSLNQLHRACSSRIQYRKVCPIHGEVPNDEIVKGYEYAKDQYVVVDPEEIQKLRVESDRSITLDGFVAPDAVDPVHHAGKTFYLAPDGAVGQKPYALLRRVMEERGVHAVARMVLSGRDQLVLLRPMGSVLALTVLEYEASVRKPEALADEVADAECTPEEIALTGTLVDASRIEDFDLGAYEDAYTTKLTALIEAKVAGEELVTPPSQEEPRILNLMEALKQSVAQAGGAPAAEAKPARKMAKSARSRKKAPARKRKSAG